VRRLTLGVVASVAVLAWCVAVPLSASASSTTISPTLPGGHPGPRIVGPAGISFAAPSRVPATATSTATCDGAFHSVASPNGPNGNQLYATSGVSPNDVWAVGVQRLSNTTFETPLALHWNGTSWGAISPPNPGVYWADLNGVVAIASNNVWAIGDYLVSLPSASFPDGVVQGFAAHWNGASWSIGATVNPSSLTFLFTIDADSATDIWAAGVVDSAGFITLVEHYNGTSWSTSPVLEHAGAGNAFENNFLFGVSAFSPTDVWVGGEYFDVDNSSLRTALAEHWNGTNWSFVTAPGLSGDNVIAFVKATAAGHAIAVGFGQNNPAVGEAWNLLTAGGSTNSVATGPGTGDNVLEGIGISGAAAWAVGYSTTSIGGVPQTLAIPGTVDSTTHAVTWGSPVTSSNPSTANNVLNAVAVTSLYDAQAVGDDTNGSNDQTLTESYCARHFTVVAPATTTPATPFSITVTASNGDGTTFTGYRGRVHFTSSDPAAVLPPDYTFVGGDSGTHTFNGVELKTPCVAQTISVADMVNPFTTPGTATVARFITGPCAASAGTAGGRTGGTASAGTPGPRPTAQSPVGTSGIRIPAGMSRALAAIAAEAPASISTAPSAAAGAASRSVTRAEVEVARRDTEATALGSAQPASVTARVVSFHDRAGVVPASPTGNPWPALMVLFVPVAVLAGLRVRRAKERANVKTRP
jgi:hypothetical protein